MAQSGWKFSTQLEATGEYAHRYTVKFITLSRLLLPELIKIRGKISPSNSSSLHQSKPAGPTRSLLSVKRFINPYVFGSTQ
jgi:hypothetical protein